MGNNAGGNGWLLDPERLLFSMFKFKDGHVHKHSLLCNPHPKGDPSQCLSFCM